MWLLEDLYLLHEFPFFYHRSCGDVCFIFLCFLDFHPIFTMTSLEAWSRTDHQSDRRNNTHPSFHFSKPRTAQDCASFTKSKHVHNACGIFKAPSAKKILVSDTFVSPWSHDHQTLSISHKPTKNDIRSIRHPQSINSTHGMALLYCLLFLHQSRSKNMRKECDKYAKNAKFLVTP